MLIHMESFCTEKLFLIRPNSGTPAGVRQEFSSTKVKVKG